MSEIDQNPPDRICEGMRGRKVLLTGGTGFLGKVILDRLLRIFDVDRVYLLLRNKKGQSGRERLKILFANPIFEKVLQTKGEGIKEKCHVIHGDVSKDNLDMKDEDREMLKENVEIILHCAANVRFDETLKNVIEINTCGTYRVLKLAKEIKTLRGFCHVSTAFCHPEEKIVREQFYKPPANPYDVMNMVKWMTDEQLDAITPTLLQGLPNTYIFSKALAEELVARETNNSNFYSAVVRPSIVVPIWKEPLPGWTDNLYGPVGMLIAGGKGVVRSMHGNEDAVADFVAVDVVADAIFIGIAYYLEMGVEANNKVYNFCMSSEVTVTWKDLVDMGKVVAKEMPFDTVLWYPGGAIRKSKFKHTLAMIFYHFLPALLVDALAFCFGYKPFLWRIQKRIFDGSKFLEYFTTNEWKFANDNVMHIRSWKNSTERKKYAVDPSDLDLKQYFINCAHGARKYILKEPDENLPRARRLSKIMYWLDRLVSVSIKVLLVYLFYACILIPLLKYVNCHKD